MIRRMANLTVELALQEFRKRYRGTFLGILWAFVVPLTFLSTMCVAFSIVMKMEVEYYPLYVLLGMMVWNFLTETVAESMSSLEWKGELLGKMVLPRSLVILSSCASAIINFGIMLAVFVILMVVFNVRFSSALLFLPVPLFELLALTTGLGFASVAACARYKDMRHVWGIISTIGFWVTPIIYPLSQVPQPYNRIIGLNPVAWIIEGFRDCLLYGKLRGLRETAVIAGTSLFVLTAGYAAFRLSRKYFTTGT